MPRTKKVSIAGRELLVEERRIGELKALIASLIPGSGGNLANIDIGRLLEINVEDLLYKKLPELFPGLTAEDVDNAYMNEVEASVEAFIDVHFFGLKSLIQPLMRLAQAGAMQQTIAAPPLKTPTSARAGTTRKR